jgi:protein-S-isoprenylcysteine O-methyltransferase Ste14
VSRAVPWGVVYAALLGALFVRVRTADTPLPEPVAPAPHEPVWLVRVHHALVYAVLGGAPLEAGLVGEHAAGRGAGAVLFALGVAGYRLAGRALGAALSPLIAPRPGAHLVTRGPYRWLRHPMYLAQALIAVGAPLTLGCRWILAPAAAALAVLVVRASVEDAALARAFPEHRRYAARTKRFLPFLY